MSSVRSFASYVPAVLGLLIGLFGFLLIPIYDQPFVGCSSGSRISFQRGCSVWPETLRGFVLVIPVIFLAPRFWRLAVFMVITLFALAIFGGLEGISAGSHLAEGSFPLYWPAYPAGYLNFLGGMSALISWLILRKIYFRSQRSTA